VNVVGVNACTHHIHNHYYGVHAQMATNMFDKLMKSGMPNQLKKTKGMSIPKPKIRKPRQESMADFIKKRNKTGNKY